MKIIGPIQSLNTWSPTLEHKKYSAVIFDMDGLMLDTERTGFTAWSRALSDWGYSLSEDQYLQILGYKIHDAENIFRKNFGQDLPFKEILVRKQIYLDEYAAANGIAIKPGLLEVLTLLEKLSKRIALASSTGFDLVQQRLMQAGLENRFKTIVTGDDIKNGKPSPDIFLLAAKKIDVSPDLCIVLEDSEAGIQAAHSAGMIPILVPDLGSPSARAVSLAWKVCPSLNEVLGFLEE